MRLKIKKIIQSKDVKKFIIFSFIIFLGFYAGVNVNKLSSFFPKKISGGEVINARALEEGLENKNFFLVNVHSPYEGEIAKTDMFVEYNYISANKDKFPEDKSAPIILYCKSGRMSKEALATLKGMGYTNVRHLEGGMEAWEKAGNKRLDLSDLSSEVLPEEGYELPITWGRLGKEMTDIGVIDLQKFEQAMNLTDRQKEILNGSDENIVINSQNSRFVVNMLWALGLAQKSKVYEEGPMGTDYKNKVGNFASTGGWTLAKGDAVNYLGRYELVSLTEEEQLRVSEIAKNVYRPCCGNNTWFPDCNHGMAALSAIELMVSSGASDDEIYRNILRLNSYWFPTTYVQVATHFARQGVDWNGVDAKLVLGEEYSSARGAAELAKKVGPLPYEIRGVGGSCGA